MKFAIFNEIEIDGKKKLKVLSELEQDKIIESVIKELNELGLTIENVSVAFRRTISKFKKESIRIP